MLASMLLHVVEAAGPVYAAFYGTGGELAVDYMDDVVAFFADIEDGGFVEDAEVVGLATGRGVEGGLIKENLPGGLCAGGALRGLRRRATEETGFEILQIGIVVVEAVRAHGKNVSTWI